MKNKYVFVLVLFVVILFAGTVFTKVYLHYEDQNENEEDLVVVTSFYPMYIAAMNVIGDAPGVTLENLSEPKTGCLHDYQLTAADMKLLSTADVFIINGGGIESFLSDVGEAYPNLQIINACENIELIEENAHAWMDMQDYCQQIQNMSDNLAKADETHADLYAANAADYIAKVQVLEQKAEQVKDEIAGQNIVIFHEAYEYVAKEYGLNVSYVMDLDEERQVSAGEVADVINEVNGNDVHVILAEELYGKDMGDMMEKETTVKVTYLDTLVRGEYDADSYLDAMSQNIEKIREAFGQ